ncbi:MAG TPA: hypothetical protein VMJ75_29945 [Candidatus Acidoferrales bacterium]|nr:hypothetical protein [Candidatus Acidoferrales bacterium]
MDVERTIEFILESQATTAVQIGKLAENDARMMRRIDGLTKLVQIGMRQLNKLAEAQKQLAAAQKDLAAAQKDLAASQKKTETTLRAFIDSMNKGGNGAKGRNGH